MNALVAVLPLRLRTWGRAHAQALVFALGHLWRSPLAGIMGAAVIGIALALPGVMFVLLDDLKTLSGPWDEAGRISLFVAVAAGDSRAGEIAAELPSHPGVARVGLITRDQALAEFRTLSGFGGALDALEANPLPPVVEVTPADPDPAAVAALARELAAIPGVEAARVDLEWVQRMRGAIDIGRRAVQVIAALLSLAVLLVVGNTIRLDIENRREEIVTAKLVGATDAFVRRPFLYGGLWLGLAGGLLAWLMVWTALSVLKGPVAHLAGLYASDFRLAGPGLIALGDLVILGVLLGLAGSWLAVTRHLARIQPT